MSFIQNITGGAASYGVIYLTNSFTGIAFSYTTSYKEITGLAVSFNLGPTVQDFGMSTDGRLKYTGTDTKLFSVCSILGSTGTSNVLSLQLYKNGSALTDSLVCGIESLRMSYYEVSLSTNDYISLFIKSQSAFSGNIRIAMISACSINRV